MITTSDQAQKIYRLLRPNGGGSSAEIRGTVNRRSFAKFLNDAQPEVKARDAGIKSLKAKSDKLSKTVSTLQAQGRTKDQKINEYAATIKKLQDQLVEANNKEPQVVIKEVEKIVSQSRSRLLFQE